MSMSRLFHSPMSTPSRRAIKRSKLPPALDLEPFLTPPLTVKRADDKIYNFSEKKNYNLDEVSPLYYKQKNIIKEVCSICEEPITLKLQNEKTIELDCTHQCHYDCYMLSLNKENLDDLPSCSVCDSVNVKPKDEEILGEIYSKTLTTPIASQNLLDSPIEFLPKPQISGFNPYTPINQLIDNQNSAGFQTSIKSAISSNSTLNSPIPKCNTDDLKVPQVNLIPEYSKYNLSGNQTVHSLLNIFTNELNPPRDDYGLTSDEQASLKKQIHEEIVTLFNDGIKNTSINFKEFKNLKLFDFMNISVDGLHWEACYAFIFDDENLILVNERFNTLVGSILLKDHSSCYKRNQDTLILTFKTQALPELQLQSLNNVLITKYYDYFQNKLATKSDSPLIQMSTNCWDLIEGSDIKIPQEIRRFNELTAKGLNLPFLMKKAIMPIPKSLKKDIILVIQLFNDSTLPDDEYLYQIQTIIRATLAKLQPNDRLGLVLLGRDGIRALGVEKASYFGMIDVKWDGWDELIEELEVFQIKKDEINGCEYFDLTINTTLKLVSMISTEEQRIKKLIMVNSVQFEDVFDNNKILKLFERGYYVEYVDVSSRFNNFNKSIVNKLLEYHEISQRSLQLFKQFEYKSFIELDELIQDLETSLTKRYYIANITVELSVPQAYKQCFKLKSLDTLKFQDVDKANIILNSLDDGYYKNIMFDIEVDYNELYKKIHKGAYIELPIINYKIRYNNEMISRTLLVKFSISGKAKPIPKTDSSSKDREESNSQSEFIDIPLLPPLSSLKDSLFVKREIELLVISHLYTGKDLNEMVSLIFGMIRGCSTSYLDFYRQSKFKFQFTNFTNFIDELTKKLRTLDGDDEKYTLINQLKSERYSFASV